MSKFFVLGAMAIALFFFVLIYNINNDNLR